MKKYLALYDNLNQTISSGALRPGMRLPTENELAESFGISRQTVRRALAKLQQDGRIYSIQGSGSFVAFSNHSAVANNRIAVITTYFSDYIFPAIIRGINSVSFEHSFTLEMHATNNSISVERSILSGLLSKPVSGIIVEGTKAALPNPNTVYYRQLSQSGAPIVFINSIYPQLEGQNGIVSVCADDYAGGYQLVSRLIDEGHTRIGGIFKSDDSQGINRFSGAIDALVNLGASFSDRDFVWFATETKHSFLQSLPADNLFNSCTAVLCYNDEIAALVLAHLKRIAKHTVRTVASFDDNLNPAIVPRGIKLYSLQHPKQALGETAANTLLNMLMGRRETSIVLPWVGCSEYEFSAD